AATAHLGQERGCRGTTGDLLGPPVQGVGDQVLTAEGPVVAGLGRQVVLVLFGGDAGADLVEMLLDDHVVAVRDPLGVLGAALLRGARAPLDRSVGVASARGRLLSGGLGRRAVCPGRRREGIVTPERTLRCTVFALLCAPEASNTPTRSPDRVPGGGGGRGAICPGRRREGSVTPLRPLGCTVLALLSAQESPHSRSRYRDRAAVPCRRAARPAGPAHSAHTRWSRTEVSSRCTRRSAGTGPAITRSVRAATGQIPARARWPILSAVARPTTRRAWPIIIRVTPDSASELQVSPASRSRPTVPTNMVSSHRSRMVAVASGPVSSKEYGSATPPSTTVRTDGRSTASVAMFKAAQTTVRPGLPLRESSSGRETARRAVEVVVRPPLKPTIWPGSIREAACTATRS